MAISAQRRLLSEMAALAGRLANELAGQEFASATPDVVAQAAVCAAPILAAKSMDTDAALDWLRAGLAPWEAWSLQTAEQLSTKYSVLSTEYEVQNGRPSSPPALPLSVSPFHFPSTLSPAHLYDAFLHRYARDSRKRHGVFFTPQPIADSIVRRLDAALRTDFGLVDGIAHGALGFLDPACGTGVFLLALLDELHARCTADWNDVAANFLSRLIGIELLPAAAFLAKLNITLKLAATGYDFKQPGNLQIHAGDALDFNLQSAICNLQFAIPVILGNPPFSSLSNSANPWISRLVRGDGEVRGYVRAGNERLGERKTWLHDDYVKFIRLAQWHVETAGCGLVGFVTNRGYLDNATFRLMRHELLRVFPRIRILDLHGSRKADEIAPGGERDANVFGLDQGVAIGLFSRPIATNPHSSEDVPLSQVEYADLWGSREAKLATLASGGEPPEAARLNVAAPDYVFTPVLSRTACPKFAAAWSLAEAMPVNATAPVTARDHFVVAFTAEALRERIEVFCDLSIGDDEIRRRYFQRTRSARYETGDTRGWKLAAARQVIAADENWCARIARCLYRPFDWRFVFWHPAMIDWPRTEVTRHLIRGSGFRVQGSDECGMAASPDSEPRTLIPEPFCLIARRQHPPGQPASYFWIADGLALDGVIRSDNRGSESLFPLYLREGAGWRANFDSRFLHDFQSRLELAWLPLGRGDLTATFGPEDLLGYIYALFHAPSYRRDYADALRGGFPRILLPQAAQSFATLSRLGCELIDLHLLREPQTTLHANATAHDVASFRAGGYLALRKWLQPGHRSSSDLQYRQIAGAIAATLQRLPQIDRALAPRPVEMATVTG